MYCSIFLSFQSLYQLFTPYIDTHHLSHEGRVGFVSSAACDSNFFFLNNPLSLVNGTHMSMGIGNSDMGAIESYQ